MRSLIQTLYNFNEYYEHLIQDVILLLLFLFLALSIKRIKVQTYYENSCFQSNMRSNKVYFLRSNNFLSRSSKVILHHVLKILFLFIVQTWNIKIPIMIPLKSFQDWQPISWRNWKQANLDQIHSAILLVAQSQNWKMKRKIKLYAFILFVW